MGDARSIDGGETGALWCDFGVTEERPSTTIGTLSQPLRYRKQRNFLGENCKVLSAMPKLRLSIATIWALADESNAAPSTPTMFGPFTVSSNACNGTTKCRSFRHWKRSLPLLLPKSTRPSPHPACAGPRSTRLRNAAKHVVRQ